MIIVTLLLVVVFLLTSGGRLDPDFGWHLRMGQLILQQGIPHTDPFSYTMPNYPFVDHEWLVDVGIAWVYPYLEIFGLAMIFGLLAFGAIFLQVMMAQPKWRLMPFILCGIGLLPTIGIRPQIFSWVFFSVLLLMLLKEQLWQRFRWGLPILFFLWGNVHAGFALGFLVVVVSVVVKHWQEKKLVVSDWLVVVGCFLATLCNPYHLRIWWEVWVSMSDSSLRWTIQEWWPALFTANMGFILLFSLSLVLLIRYRKHYSRLELVLFCLLLTAGLSSARQLPFWFLLAVPLTARGIGYLSREANTVSGGKKRFALAYRIFFCLVALVSVLQVLIIMPFGGRSVFASYPQQAINFLTTHPSSGNLLAEYNWGGYLIWKYPEKKVFVDGRMPSWRQTPTAYESAHAFREYQEIMSGRTQLGPLLTKYHIDTVLLSRDVPDQYPVWFKTFVERLFSVQLPNKPLLERQLRQQGMHVIYSDGMSILYRK